MENCVEISLRDAFVRMLLRAYEFSLILSDESLANMEKCFIEREFY